MYRLQALIRAPGKTTVDEGVFSLVKRNRGLLLHFPPCLGHGGRWVGWGTDSLSTEPVSCNDMMSRTGVPVNALDADTQGWELVPERQLKVQGLSAGSSKRFQGHVARTTDIQAANRYPLGKRPWAT